MKSVGKHNQTLRFILSSLAFLFLFSFQLSAQEIDSVQVRTGKKIFNANCASCHKLQGNLIGPELGGVEDRRTNEWLKLWIKDNAALRASGDADAIAIFNEYNGSVMTAFPQLSDEDIDAILAYTTHGDIDKVAVAGDDVVVEEEEPSTAWMSYIVLAALVLLTLWVYFRSKNEFLKLVTTIALLLATAYYGYGAMMAVGIDQGYEPIQPIAFSHKIHAGENKVDCQYCHSSAKHSKHSGIPSVNVCMNCHKSIAEVAEDTKVEWDGQTLGKPELDAEIQKIYDAIGWDKEKFAYIEGYEQKPIKWTRIHALPDFAYFNHSQHVTVGGLACQQCHGPVQEMDEMYQYSPLTMGWCIECHRETEVNLAGNEYYKKIHEELSKKYGIEKVTVAQLGGQECGKCHY
ncbi:MAG: c-type cytochrome [Flavobacteriaceae bacterium]|nr:c-type cytochrome [Flavobacteriaceae bacterium]